MSLIHNMYFGITLLDLIAIIVFKKFIFKGFRPVLEGFVVPMHKGTCETGSQILRALARGIWRTVRTSPSALGQQTATDRS